MVQMSRAEIERLLAEALIGRLAMADLEGQPYVIPLPFCWHQGAIYVRVGYTGRKDAVLRQNNRVCFEVDWFDPLLSDYASILVEGRLREVADMDEKAQVKAANEAKYVRLRNGYRPGHGRTTALETLPLRKIEVSVLCGRKKEQSD